MSPRKRRQNPLERSYLLTARRLDREWPGRKPDELSRATVLATLRRRFFMTLAGPGQDSSAARWWDFCAEADCPMLDDGLDTGSPDGLDPGKAVELAVPVEGEPDIAELFQELQELGLKRERQGSLVLSRERTARRRAGQFFTPQWMARRLTDMALDGLLESSRRRLRILDPASGSGRLLLECLARLLPGSVGNGRQRGMKVRRLASQSIRGVDLDPLAVALSRSLLWILADPALGPFDELGDIIRQGDAICGSLTGEPSGKESLDWDSLGKEFDAVVANPPFEVLKGFRRRKGLKDYAERIRKSGYRLALSGNLNTYRLFLERALDLLAEGGRLAFVLPFGFLMDRTAAPLRTHMLRSGLIDRVETYPESARAFYRVGQSVALVSAGKGRRPYRTVLMKDGTGKQKDYRLRVERLESLDAESLPIPIIPEDVLDLAARMRERNPSSLEELAVGRVGEVDQTLYRSFMKSRRASALLVRGAHLSPFRADLDRRKKTERWLDAEGFARARGGGRWRKDIEGPRVVQTGIVNMEAGRRLVAARVPKGVYLGNSLNYWVPERRSDLGLPELRVYLLGLLNSTPLEWRFRVTSSNNNINLYEVKKLPVPRLTGDFPAGRASGFLDRAVDWAVREPPGDAHERIRSAPDAPGRDDRVVARLIGRVAQRREKCSDPRTINRLDAVLDHLVNWHLGLEPPDLVRMLADVPARAWREEP